MDKRLIAPIVVAVCLVLGLAAYIVVGAMLPIPMIFKIFIALVYLALIGVAIFVLVERIKEIRSGETDDLDNY
ncbi:hypothetical protein LJC07_08280 [Christensenellaceae bacterium OttesenSCG-928-L17]|nr:hypothetical protein [Christensenellaceae bacterium OttesenSCG-928-L17]